MVKKKDISATPAASLVGAHGTARLPRVEVDGYNLELKDDNGFLGDRASKRALYALLDKWRKPLAKEGKDPFGERPSSQIGKKELDEALAKGDTAEAGVVHAVIECIGDHETEIVMHNDAVVQGLSEVPFMTGVKRWGVLTLGTGLGNARFTNREPVNGEVK